jgi:hypothetical protein
MKNQDQKQTEKRPEVTELTLEQLQVVSGGRRRRSGRSAN